MTKPMMVFLAFFLYVFVYSAFVEPNTLEVTRYRIENQQLRGLRIAFLSDFHLKRHAYKRLDKIIKTTEKENPDIVIEPSLKGEVFRGGLRMRCSIAEIK